MAWGSSLHLVSTVSLAWVLGWQRLTCQTAWNLYQCDFTADVLLKQAQAMVDHGLVKAGYNVRCPKSCYHPFIN